MILLMGLPGAGKGTQGKMMADTRGMHLISMGELVRMYVTGERRQRMLAGELLDDQEVIAMLDQVLRNIEDDDDVVLDGFPRTIPQAEWLMEQVKQDRFEISRVFHLVASREAVQARLKARGRLDDEQSVIEERFKEYDALTKPVIKWLEDRGILIIDINAEQAAAAVNDDVIKSLQQK